MRTRVEFACCKLIEKIVAYQILARIPAGMATLGGV
jgi:hypothetical protein